MNGPTFGWWKMLSSASARSCCRGLARRDHTLHRVRIGEQPLLAGVVLLGEQLHRQDLVRHGPAGVAEAAVAGRTEGARPVPSREHVREPFDDRLVVRRDRLVVGVQLRRAVRVELDQADREELHELARVVLVGADIELRVRLPVPQHREIDAHHRVQRDLLDQLAEIAEGVARERVVVVREADRIPVGERDLRGDQDLRQRPCHALAQLVAAPHRVLEPDVPALKIELGVVETRRGRDRPCRLHVGELRGRRQLHLLVDPARVRGCRVAERDQTFRLGFGRAERGLV